MSLGLDENRLRKLAEGQGKFQFLAKGTRSLNTRELNYGSIVREMSSTFDTGSAMYTSP